MTFRRWACRPAVRLLRGEHRPVLFVAALLLAGCAASQVAVAPEASGVVTGTQPPPGPRQELGAVTGTHGGGCGLYGARGNYEGAYTVLRNKAAALGANYVQILRMTEPQLIGPCFQNQYIIDGTAYRVTAEAPRSAAPTGSAQPMMKTWMAIQGQTAALPSRAESAPTSGVWVLWGRTVNVDLTKGPEPQVQTAWARVRASADRTECELGRRAAIEGLRGEQSAALQRAGYTVTAMDDGVGFTAPQRDGFAITYHCWPETIDPRR